jgi:hypothetical protein
MAAIAKRTTRTSEGLRATLFETLDNFINGKIDATEAKTIAKLSDSLLKSIALDMEYKRLVNDMISQRGPEKALANMNLNIVMGEHQDQLSRTTA